MNRQQMTRRAALTNMGIGLGSIGLSSLLAETSSPSQSALKPPHFAPRAKQVILLFSGGGVSQLDLFDPKPELVKRKGQFPPNELLKGERFAFINPKSKQTIMARIVALNHVSVNIGDALQVESIH